MTRSEQFSKQNFSKNNGNSSVMKVGSNAPKATAEQLNLARLLTTNSDDGDRQFKLKQVMLGFVAYFFRFRNAPNAT